MKMKIQNIYIIKNAYNGIKLCIHVTRQAPIYLAYTENLLEECLISEQEEKITTADINIKSTGIIKYTEKIIKSTDNIQQKIETEKISITSEYLNPLDSTEFESFGSTETNNLNTSVDIIINDTFFLQGYNNSQIYDKIIQNLLQVFAGDKDQKIFIKGKDNFMFELTTQESELEILNMNGMSIRRDLSVIDLGECINLLKNKCYPNRNDDISFIILKHEKITNISSEKIIQYEVYDPFDYRKLDISICQNVSIIFQ